MAVRENVRFVRQAIRNPGTVGAILPSSAALARRMTDDIAIGDGQIILELGPGTGSMTHALRTNLASPSSYLGIELAPRFVHGLKERFPELRFVQGSAVEARRHLVAAGFDQPTVHAVICGMPFGSIGPRTQNRMIIQLHRIMQPGAEFRCFQYLHAFMLPLARRFRRRMSERFGPYRVSRPVLANVPPAVVLTWTR
jgi:phospholipid N-methyltransferase